jgi:hypothetical protein
MVCTKKGFGLKPQAMAFFQSPVRILRQGHAMRVVFFYPGEEGTYVDNVEVTLYENGIVQITSEHEDSTTDIRNCEILWKYQTEADEKTPKVRLLRGQPEPEAP